MIPRILSNTKNATSTVTSVIETDPKEERALVWRLDLFFLTIGFLGYVFKYLDQTNIVGSSGTLEAVSF
ncbi:hypothetical protein PENANT_c007G00131 [Penicillium antarcticum]|uniref:Major facilitator superfamily (MFS) profile domain-containing protein n=2 Tax=Penicillium antarcticum TaxID=416450 RepID=A0A1V6QC32_9EURO|nr:hypothetical protein PENANT_c007G00131 [Penicillium antarcticum]